MSNDADIKTIALASDHAGYTHKERIKVYLDSRGYKVKDFGIDSEDKRVDYPDFVLPAANAVAGGACDAGIVVGGSGNGEAIAANKIRGIRCAVCWNTQSARLARQHNDANMIAMGQRMLPAPMALQIVEAWLRAHFEGGRHARRIKQIAAVEKNKS